VSTAAKNNKLIYNVTTAVANELATDWEHWLLTEHAPEIIATGCFTKFHLLKLLQLDDAEGTTYAVQYYAESMEAYDHYISDYAPTMRQKAIDKWGNGSVSFRTVMEVIR
jgi:hypothetical protein